MPHTSLWWVEGRVAYQTLTLEAFTWGDMHCLCSYFIGQREFMAMPNFKDGGEVQSYICLEDNIGLYIKSPNVYQSRYSNFTWLMVWCDLPRSSSNERSRYLLQKKLHSFLPVYRWLAFKFWQAVMLILLCLRSEHVQLFGQAHYEWKHFNFKY